MARTPHIPRRPTRRPAPAGSDEPAAAEAMADLADLMTRLGQADKGPDGQVMLEALGTLRRLRDQLAAWEPALIEAARTQGLTWTEIAPALGLASRQAAERRFLRLNPQAGDQAATTHEERVQTTRDRRSGDRAVAAWARDHAAQLRELAGQITALPVRDQGGRATREAVHTALGNDDAATLLAPLRAVEPALRRKHRALAERIASLDETTDRIRNADHRRRNSAPR
ncbi:hypothetical protein SAMN05421678_12033 [Actinopolymorpha cephalotaxi]|uniref:HSP18 transcriptional regulator n=1 Tax=Actinopolymorpha cephalotaxi TaxID=504797 RepID=A0A1I3AQY0_9ACTN|nr:hypothetical protein [Actinopolymorpha cephalotaxi]NYH86019.1 hypothetical protein [Actinopolymorpha cephalotaxi]SFH52423.1 hypothetical protein SAMN05421678_12033 [Actinopolymorpha cephalotaxi]